MFMNAMSNELNKKTQLTENMAVGYSTSGKALGDMNFRVSSYRNMSENDILRDFMKAYAEDRIMAMRWLFYARDIRGGLGERRLFRVIVEGLAKYESATVAKVMNLIAMFGRWDDLFVLAGTSLEKEMFKVVAKQLMGDLENYRNGNSISLLAKWMPSINCSDKTRIALANKFVAEFKITQKEYRKTLSTLRAYLNVVECKMSANDWGSIDYSAIPSRANLIYNPTFLKHDSDRRREFLAKVEKGEEKINAATLFPHDIVAKYAGNRGNDPAIEALWKALPNYGALESTLVVADGSGSMTATIMNTKVRSLDVANALAIYFAERCEGEFKNKYITFSETPQLVNLGVGTLASKVRIAETHCEVANTNIEAVFNLVLKTAITNGMAQNQLPGTILIISDMEFDSCTTSGGWYGTRSSSFRSPSATLFGEIAKRFASEGYKMPKLAFWNVMSRSLTIPVAQNDMGVALVSGFSPAAIKMVLSGKVDPYDALIEVLMSPRYDIVQKSLE